MLKIDDKPVGQHEFVVQFMKGIFMAKLTEPRSFRDTKIVLNYSASFEPMESLSHKALTLKTLTLLLLV